MGKESMTTAARVEEDFAKASTQLKAEHVKEDAALKKQEAEKAAALKHEHDATAGKTGFLAKLTGHEDPVKKAENQHLKAEIVRAEQQTKSAHAIEKAELEAAKNKELAAAQAADKLHNPGHHNAGGGHHNVVPGATAVNNAGASYAPSNYNAAPGHHNNPNAFGSTDASMAGPLTKEEKKVYNYATGSYGQAAIEDGRRQEAEINAINTHHGAEHHGGEHLSQFAPQGIAAMPMAVGAQPVMATHQPMMGTHTHQPMMGSQPVMGTEQIIIQPAAAMNQTGHFSR